MNRALFWGLLFSPSVAFASAEGDVRRFAIVVGYNEASQGGRTLRYADDDAGRFFELIRSVSGEAHLLTMFDKQSQELFSELIHVARAPSKRAVLATLRAVKKKVQAHALAGGQSEIYFFYAGHGDVEGGVGFLTLQDGRLTRPEFRRELLEDSGAKAVHVFIDACRSYFFVAGRGPGGWRVKYDAAFAGPRPYPGVGYVLSTSNEAESHEWSEFSGGIFSHEIRSALLGGADINLDGQVDYQELAAFVAVANESIPYPTYRPNVFIQPPPEAHASSVFATSEVDAAWLEIDAEDSGRVSIIDERGLRYADAHKSRGHRMKVALLQPRRYEVRWKKRQYSVERTEGPLRRARSASSASSVGSGEAVLLSGLRVATTTIAARNEAHRAFGHLFERPFSTEVVRGYRLGRTASSPASIEVSVGMSKTQRTWMIGLLAGGVGAVAGGMALAIASDGTSRSLLTANGVDQEALARRADRLAWGAGGLLTVGLGALVGSLFLFLVEP